MLHNLIVTLVKQRVHSHYAMVGQSNIVTVQSLCSGCAAIAKWLRSHCALGAQPLHSGCAAMAQRVRSHCAAGAQPLRSECAAIAQRVRSPVIVHHNLIVTHS